MPNEVLDKYIELVAAQSIRNCHAHGVDSLVLCNKPMIRAFVCRSDHELWLNCPSLDYPLSVGLHPHHCDVTLAPIYGRAYNVTHRDGASKEPVQLQAFNYQSNITGLGGKFTRLGFSRGFTLAAKLIDKPLVMGANEIHTIFVPQGEEAAWFVLEGAESQNYRAITYSNCDLEKLDFAGLYQPMTVDYTKELMAKIQPGGING